MKRVKLADWTLDVDVDKTLHFNQNKLEVCGCLYCKNFAAVIGQKHLLLRETLLEIGIDARTPNHVSYFEREEDRQYWALGNYHISGAMVHGEWSTMADWKDSNTTVVDGMKIGLSKEMELLPRNFPKPVIQVNFEWLMPWVLDEDPEE